LANPLKTLAIIVTFNSARYIAECLTSLLESSPNIPILVVDNASSDGTSSLVHQRFTNVIVIETGSNLGYAGGNNLGLRYAADNNYEFALIANPDCTFSKDCVPGLVSALVAHPNVAAASPVIFRADGTTVWYAGADLDVRRGTSQHVIEVPSPSGPDIVMTKRANGCAMVVRLTAIKRIGNFDERYFLYYEEAEWCARCADAGLDIVVVPTSVAFHDVGHGIGGMSDSYLYYMTRNRLILIQQYGGHVLPALPYCFYTSFQSISPVMRTSIRLGIIRTGAIMKGYVDFLRGRAGRQLPNFRWWPVRPMSGQEVQEPSE
jgi:GT2 family glycosyltransferase